MPHFFPPLVCLAHALAPTSSTRSNRPFKLDYLYSTSSSGFSKISAFLSEFIQARDLQSPTCCQVPTSRRMDTPFSCFPPSSPAPKSIDTDRFYTRAIDSSTVVTRPQVESTREYHSVTS
ncbi:hypothetical protein ABKN59_006699 [Abortiporus biennis]